MFRPKLLPSFTPLDAATNDASEEGKETVPTFAEVTGSLPVVVTPTIGIPLVVPPVAGTPVGTTLVAPEEIVELTLTEPLPDDCGLKPTTLIKLGFPVGTVIIVPLGPAGGNEGAFALLLPIIPGRLLPSELPLSALVPPGCILLPIVTILVVGMAVVSPALLFMPLLTVTAPAGVTEGRCPTVTAAPEVTTDTVVPEETVLARLGGLMGCTIPGSLGIADTGVVCRGIPAEPTDGMPGLEITVPDVRVSSIVVPGVVGKDEPTPL